MAAQLKLKDVNNQEAKVLLDGVAGQAVEVYFELIITQSNVEAEPFTDVMSLGNVGKYTDPTWELFGPSAPNPPSLSGEAGTPSTKKSFTPNYPGRWLVRLKAKPIIQGSNNTAITGNEMEFTALFEILDPNVLGHPESTITTASLMAPNEGAEYDATVGWSRSIESFLTTVSKQLGGRHLVTGANASGQVLPSGTVLKLHADALARWKGVSGDVDEFQSFGVQFDRAKSGDSGIEYQPLFLTVQDQIATSERTYAVWEGIVPYDTTTLGAGASVGDRIYLTAAGGLSVTPPGSGEVLVVGTIIKLTNAATPDAPGTIYFSGENGAQPGVVMGPTASELNTMPIWSDTDGTHLGNNANGPWVESSGKFGIHVPYSSITADLHVDGTGLFTGNVTAADLTAGSVKLNSGAAVFTAGAAPTTGAGEGALYVDQADGHVKYRAASSGAIFDLTIASDQNALVSSGTTEQYAVATWTDALGTSLTFTDLRIGDPSHNASTISTDSSASAVKSISLKTGELQGAGAPGHIHLIGGPSGAASSSASYNDVASEVRIAGGLSEGDPEGGSVHLLGGNKTADPSSSGRAAGSVNITGGTASNDIVGDGGDVVIAGGVGSTNNNSTTGVVALQPSAGFVGIGTAAPTVALDVTGEGKFSGTVTGNTPTAAAHLTTKDFVETYVATQIATSDELGELTDVDLTTPAEGQLLVKGASNWENSDAVYVKSGKVGIGVTNPVKELQVDGAITVKNNHGYTQYDAAGNIATVVNQTGGDALNIGDATHTDSINLNAGGSAAVTIDSSANVGISGALTVGGLISGVTDPVGAQDAATKGWVDSQITANDELGELTDVTISTPTEGQIMVRGSTEWSNDGTLTVDASNNRVGIGTSTPTTELHVDGAVTVSGLISGVTDPASAQDAATKGWVEAQITANDELSELSDVTVSTPAEGQILVRGASDWANDGTLTVDTGNNRVGIGTTSPSEALDVSGAISSSGDITSEGNITAKKSFPDITLKSNAGSEEGRFLWSDAGGAAHGAIKMQPNDSAPMRFFTSGIGASDERMRIDSDGKIGVGTTSPAAKLDVSGDLKVSGSTRLNNINYSWPGADGGTGQVLSTNGSGTLSWADGGSGGSSNSGAYVIAPFAYAHIDTVNAGTGHGMSWGAFNSSSGAIAITFTAAQPNTNYVVVTDREEYEQHDIVISGKTTAGFTASFMNSPPSTNALSPATFPGTIMVYGSNPKVNVGGGTGSIFIHSLTPDTGNIGVTMAENNTRVDSAVADASVSQITVGVFAYPGGQNVRPSATVNSQAVTWSTSPSQSLTTYFGTATVSMSSGDIVAEHEDGATHTITVSSDPAPVISSLAFTGSYPGSQTELKSGDSYSISVTADIAFDRVEVENSGAAQADTITGLNATTHAFSITAANRGTSTQVLPARVRVRKSTGTWSAWVYTNAGGSTDGVNVVNLNNTYPTVGAMSQGSITYPSGQEAIKDTESVTIASACSNFDTITYSSPNSQLTITGSTSYAANKTASRAAGGYNVTSNNYRIVANRAANNATTTKNLVVYIAHDAPQISLSYSQYFRSGGADGTSVQNHTITLNSNQKLLGSAAPVIADPPTGQGSWSGTFGSGQGPSYTRTLQVNDSDTKGSHSFGALSGITNKAGKVVTAYTGSSTYTLQGFVSRTITLAAFANEATMNVAAKNYSNVALTWSVKSLTNKRAVGTTATPDANSWCLHTDYTDSSTPPTIIRILDTGATGSSSVATQITIEETV